jgi:hypothetical protein
MKKFLLLLSVGMAALLSTCSGDVVEQEIPQPPIQTEAKLTVVVRNASDNTLLTDAEVTLLSSDLKGTTDAAGVVTFDNIYVGNYRLLVTKKGYADMYVNAQIAGQTDENIHVATDNSVDVLLRPEDAGLFGYVHFINKKGEPVAAQGVKVFVKLTGESFNERRYDALELTDADGRYEFAQLPAVGTAYEIWAEGKTLDGIVFETFRMTSAAALISKGSVNNGIATFTESNSFFEVLPFNSMVKEKEALVFKFSESIDKEWFKTSMVVLNTTVPVSKNWSEDGKTLTITPMGKWENDFTVAFNNLKSENGKELTYNTYTPAQPEEGYCYFYNIRYQSDCNTYGFSWDWGMYMCLGYFDKPDCDWFNSLGSHDHSNYWQITNPATPEIYTDIYPITVTQKDLSNEKIKVEMLQKADAIDYDAQRVDLRWDIVEGADGYRIYRKVNEEGYKPIATVLTSDMGSAKRIYKDGVELNENGDYINGDKVSFIVQAYNRSSQSKLDISDAQRLDVSDVVKPELTSDLGIFSDWVENGSVIKYLYTNPNKDEDMQINERCLEFSEPMDMPELLEEKEGDWTSGRLLIKHSWKWWSNSLCLTLYVKAGDALSDAVFSADYKLDWLKDKAGNELVDGSTKKINIKATK